MKIEVSTFDPKVGDVWDEQPIVVTLTTSIKEVLTKGQGQFNSQISSLAAKEFWEVHKKEIMKAIAKDKEYFAEVLDMLKSNIKDRIEYY